MLNAPLLEIFVFAAIAGVILVRLYTVLGRRTGHERAPPEPVRAPAIAALPETPVPANDPVARGLLDIKLADRNFETDRFLTGARSAYERIVTAFAAGDRDSLRPLLSDEVYQAFDTAITQRQARGESVSFSFAGFRDVKIVQAGMREQSAEITLSFGGRFVSVTRDRNGTIIEGDEKAVRDVTDLWTFSRDVRARDPGWPLVATSGELP